MRSLILAIVFVTLLCGCTSPKPHVATVRPGDRLLIKFIAVPAPDIRQLVDAAGDITLPLAGKLHVGGMTLDEVRQQVEIAYRRSWPPDQKVSVSICP